MATYGSSPFQVRTGSLRFEVSLVIYTECSKYETQYYQYYRIRNSQTADTFLISTSIVTQGRYVKVSDWLLIVKINLVDSCFLVLYLLSTTAFVM